MNMTTPSSLHNNHLDDHHAPPSEIGCKYTRGDWSSVCQDGQRVRIDTLVAFVDANGNEREAPALTDGHASPLAATPRCKPQRRVTKDCSRTCHYVKSGK